jgi:hypothetical protein
MSRNATGPASFAGGSIPPDTSAIAPHAGTDPWTLIHGERLILTYLACLSKYKIPICLEITFTFNQIKNPYECAIWPLKPRVIYL